MSYQGAVRRFINKVSTVSTATVVAFASVSGTAPLFLSQNAFAAPVGTTRTVCEVAAPDCDYTSVQDAINASTNGDTVKINPGTYNAPQFLVLAAQAGVTVVGGGVSNTFLNLTAVSDGFKVQASNVTLKNFTLDGGATANYGLRAQNISGLAVQNVKITNMKKTAFDINGVSNSTFTTLRALNNGGAGIYVTDSRNLTFNGVTTSNNAWGAIGMTAKGTSYPSLPCGTDNVTYEGALNLAEPTAMYAETDNAANPTCRVTNITVPSSILPYRVTPSNNVIKEVYVRSLGEAQAVAGAPGTNAPVIRSNADDSFVVTSSLKIQDAVNAAADNDVINVAVGSYPENVSIAKPLTLNGAQAGVDARTRSGSETTVSSFTITKSDVVIDGFSLTRVGNQINVAPSPSTGVTLSGLVFQNNIFSGYTSVGVTTNNAGNLLVQKNLFKDVSGTGQSMQIRANGTPGNGACNNTQVLANKFVNASNQGADINLSCTGSASTDVTVANNSTTGSTASFTAFSGVASGIDVRDNTATGIQDNSAIYFFGAVTGTVNIQDNAVTGGNSSAVSISNGANDGSTTNTGTFTVTDNDFSGNANGVSASTGAFGTGGMLVARGNNLSGNTNAGVKNDTSTLLDTAGNWWGAADGPTDTNKTDGSLPAANLTGSGSKVLGKVSYNTWCADVACSSFAEHDNVKPVITKPVTFSDGTVAENAATKGTKTFVVSQSEANPATIYVEYMEKNSAGNWQKKYGQEYLNTNTANFTVNTDNWGEGQHQVKISSTDGEGNKSGHSFFVNIDRTKPVVTVTAPAKDKVVSKTVTVSGTAVDDNSGVAQVTVNIRAVNQNGNCGGNLNTLTPTVDSAGNWSTTFNSANGSFADGKYCVSAFATDNAGNNNGGTHLKSFVIDNTKPSVTTPVTFLDGTNAEGATVKGIQTFVVTQTEANPDRIYVEYMEKNSAGNWQKKYGQEYLNTNTANFTVNTDNWSEGLHQIKISTRDDANNSSGYAFTVTVDRTIVVVPDEDDDNDGEGGLGGNQDEQGGTNNSTGITTTSSASQTPTTAPTGTSNFVGGLTASNNIAASTPQVLGESAGTSSEKTTSLDEKKDNKKDAEGSSNFLGLGWWWLVVLAVIAAVLGYLFLGRRAERA